MIFLEAPESIGNCTILLSIQIGVMCDTETEQGVCQSNSHTPNAVVQAMDTNHRQQAGSRKHPVRATFSVLRP